MARVHAKAKMNIPMCVACVLFCLTLFSFYFTGGLFARYVTNNEGVDSARVIKFGDISITEEGDFVSNDGKNTFMIIPGVDLKKDVELAFTGSEAATYVFVEITTEYTQTADNYTFTYGTNGNDAPILQWSVVKKSAEDSPEGWTYLTKNADKYVYYRVLAPNTPLESVDIISGTKTGSEINGEIIVNAETKSDIKSLEGKNISIKIRAAAVQAGGFKDAAEAWASVADK